MMKTKKMHRHVAQIAALGSVLSIALPVLLPLNKAYAEDAAAAAPTVKTQRQRLTPAEREAARVKMEEARAERIEQSLRTTLTRNGTTDAATQDAVIAYAKSEMVARADSSKAKTKVMQAMRTGAVTDSQFSVLLNEMHSAADQEKTRRVRSAFALDEKIGYTKKPRLEAVLVLAGLVGDAAATLGPLTPMTGGMGRGRRPANAGSNVPRVRQPRKAATTNAVPAAKDVPEAMPAP